MTPPALAAGGVDPDAFAPVLAATLDAGDVASLLLHLPGASEDAIRRAADRLRPVAQDRGVAFLLSDRPDLAAGTGADGVHLEREDADPAAARRTLGPDLILGAGCGVSRHRAMVAAEQGTDYVAFGDLAAVDGEPTADSEIAAIVAWRSELMTVPSVTFGSLGPADIDVLVRGGADFLAVGSGVWDWPDGPAAGLRAYLRAIADAREAGGASDS